MWDSKAIVFVEHYRFDVHIFLAITLWERARKGYWEVIECRNCVLRKAQSWVSDQAKDVQRPRDIHRNAVMSANDGYENLGK